MTIHLFSGILCNITETGKENTHVGYEKTVLCPSDCPQYYMGGFYALSLVIMALAAWLVWELCIMIYPERFCEMTNAALKCSECTDKLCTQYCQKLKR